MFINIILSKIDNLEAKLIWIENKRIAGKKEQADPKS